MKMLSFKFPDALAAELVAETHKRGTNQSEIVREALAYYLHTMPRKRNSGSFLDLAQDLCGCVVGPTDLSTNPKHLEEYGK